MKRYNIGLIVNQPNWAHDFAARSIRAQLKRYYNITILYSIFSPDFNHEEYDLVYVFFWGDPWTRKQYIPKHKRIQEVASLRWMEGGISPEAFYREYLCESFLLTTPSREIYNILSSVTDNIFLAYKGIEPSIFSLKPKSGSFKIGWVGSIGDPCKGFEDIIRPACEGRFELIYAGGNLTRHEVSALYKRVDVIAVSSTNESQPLPLLEGMASGCFPVCTSVGLVPELIDSKNNGLIVERNVDAFRDAFQWCSENLEYIRCSGKHNAYYIKNKKSWDFCAKRFHGLFRYALEKAERPNSNVIISKPTAADNKPYNASSTSSPLNIILKRSYWHLSDKLADLYYLKFSVNKIGVIGAIKTKLLSPAWWRRRLR